MPRVEAKPLNDVEVALKAALEEMATCTEASSWRDDARWTREVKNRVARLGRDRGFCVCASSCDLAHSGEWLFDLSWLDHRGCLLTRVPLALECEWDAGGAGDDFQKLVVARADERVMVFVTSDAVTATVAIESLLENVSSFSRTTVGDRYFFACWQERRADGCKGFSYAAYEVVHDNSG